MFLCNSHRLHGCTHCKMALKFNRKYFSCKTTLELTEVNLKWTINNVSFGFMERNRRYDSSIFQPTDDVQLSVSILEKDDGYLNFVIYKNCETSFSVTLEFFLLKSNQEVRLSEPVFRKLDADSCTCIVVSSTMTAMEMLQYKTEPEDTLTFICRFVITAEENTAEVELISATDYSMHIPPCQMQQDFETILENHLLADVTLIVEGKQLKAHKSILAARSPVFAAMFTVDMAEKRQDHVTIADMEYEVAQQMLRFIYTGKTDSESKMALRLLVAAERYALMKLKEECERIICDTITVSTAVETLILADRYNAAQLKSRVIQFIQSNADKALEGGDLRSLIVEHPDLMVELYQALTKKKIIYYHVNN